MAKAAKKPNPLLETGGEIVPDALYAHWEAARILSVCPRTLQRWSAKGVGPAVTRISKSSRPRYRGRDLLAALDNSRCEFPT